MTRAAWLVLPLLLKRPLTLLSLYDSSQADVLHEQWNSGSSWKHREPFLFFFLLYLKPIHFLRPVLWRLINKKCGHGSFLSSTRLNYGKHFRLWLSHTREQDHVLNIKMKHILHVGDALFFFSILLCQRREWVSVPHRGALTLIPRGWQQRLEIQQIFCKVQEGLSVWS